MIEKFLAFLGDNNRIPIRSGSTALYYCLTGSYMIAAEGRDVLLKEKELFVVNAGEKIGWEAESDSLLFRVSIEETRLRRYLKRGEVRFLLCGPEHRTRDYHTLLVILDAMIQHFPERDGEFALWSLYYMLWDELRKDYLVSWEEKTERADPVFDDAISEIYTHFQEPVTARVMATRYGMSESSFSRWFQKRSGTRFADCLRRIRLEYAREQLLETEIPVTDIAFKSGFSNLSVFNRNFRDYYHVTPRELRQQAGQIQESENIADTLVVQNYIDTQEKRNQRAVSNVRSIAVNSESGLPAMRNVADILGPIDAADLLEAKQQEVITDICKSLHIRSVRITNLFTDAFFMDSATSYSSEAWCFERMDLVFDFLLKNGLNPVLVLSGAREYTQTKKHTFFPLFEWKEILCSFLKHMISRYTMETINEWHFEMRYGYINPNEPDKDCSLDFYENTWKTLKEIITDVKAGVGNICVGRKEPVPEELAEKWKIGELKPAFIAVVCEPYALTEKGEKGRFIADQHYIRDQLSILRKIMKERALDNTPVWVTEWCYPHSRVALYNDTCGKACHMLMQLIDVAERAERISCGSASDWSFVSGSDSAPFFGGKGLVSKDGIPKPFFHALQMFSFMGEICLAKGDGYYITKRQDGNYSMLLYHPGIFSDIFHHSREEDLKPEALSCFFEDHNPADYQIAFRNLRNGKYTVNSFEYRSDQGNPLMEWAQLGYKKNLNFGEINYLKSICVPKITFLSEQVNDGTLILKYNLRLNDFKLVLLAPVI